VVPLAAAVGSLLGFVVVERRVANPMMEFRLFRHLNFLAANLSQLLAGAIELGLGFLLPFYLLLVVGVSPATAGIALIPGTLPIILAGPIAGRAFDRVGGRAPLAIGFAILSASGLALALAASSEAVGPLIPGLLLQGIGLGVVLTVNDPTGLTAVPERDRGQAAGIINTTEQLGGALGIASLTAIEIGYASHATLTRLADKGLHPTPDQVERFRDFILQAEQSGLHQAHQSAVARAGVDAFLGAHVDAFRLTFLVSAGIALVAALLCLAIVRRVDRVAEGRVFGRRSRWAYAAVSNRPAEPAARTAED
jgi:MFS family permease